jgi:hypothetical protein
VLATLGAADQLTIGSLTIPVSRGARHSNRQSHNRQSPPAGPLCPQAPLAELFDCGHAALYLFLPTAPWSYLPRQLSIARRMLVQYN